MVSRRKERELNRAKNPLPNPKTAQKKILELKYYQYGDCVIRGLPIPNKPFIALVLADVDEFVKISELKRNLRANCKRYAIDELPLANKKNNTLYSVQEADGTLMHHLTVYVSHLEVIEFLLLNAYNHPFMRELILWFARDILPSLQTTGVYHLPEPLPKNIDIHNYLHSPLGLAITTNNEEEQENESSLNQEVEQSNDSDYATGFIGEEMDEGFDDDSVHSESDFSEWIVGTDMNFDDDGNF
jgi:hypothetical protein